MDNQLFKQHEIENRIFTIRGMQVMLDRDLAELYGVQTKRLNEQVKRNIERFPDLFRFQLSTDERLELVANCDRLQNLKHTTSNPFAFTEQGVAMLSGVLNSEVAIKVSIRIIQTFVELRKTLFSNKGLLHRMDRFEIQLADHGKKFQQIFNALENKSLQPEQGIFFDGQLFDAYTFVSDLIRSAKTDIMLIDNYIDDTVLTMHLKRNTGVEATVFTQQISKQLKLDLDKHNQQYPIVKVVQLPSSHDRFLIIDRKELYHIGASLKDLGKKWFAFSKMDAFLNQVLSEMDNVCCANIKKL